MKKLLFKSFMSGILFAAVVLAYFLFVSNEKLEGVNYLYTTIISFMVGWTTSRILATKEEKEQYEKEVAEWNERNS